MENSLPYYLYDTFSAKRFGGSQAAIVLDATAVDASTRVELEKGLGYPATVFVADTTGGKIEAQFYSTVAELPMCGHGTIALISCLSDLNLLDWTNHLTLNFSLALPNGEAPVIATRREDRISSAFEDGDFQRAGVLPSRRLRYANTSAPSISTTLIETSTADTGLSTKIQ